MAIATNNQKNGTITFTGGTTIATGELLPEADGK
jgi:hypothetical protein